MARTAFDILGELNSRLYAQLSSQLAVAVSQLEAAMTEIATLKKQLEKPAATPAESESAVK